MHELSAQNWEEGRAISQQPLRGDNMYTIRTVCISSRPAQSMQPTLTTVRSVLSTELLTRICFICKRRIVSSTQADTRRDAGHLPIRGIVHCLPTQLINDVTNFNTILLRQASLLNLHYHCLGIHKPGRRGGGD